jgi:hypothetical protein
MLDINQVFAPAGAMYPPGDRTTECRWAGEEESRRDKGSESEDGHGDEGYIPRQHKTFLGIDVDDGLVCPTDIATYMLPVCCTHPDDPVNHGYEEERPDKDYHTNHLSGA